MSYQQQPPPPPPPPGYGAPPPPPPGAPPTGGYYYGPPQAPGAAAPHQTRGSGRAMIGIFIGALLGVAVLVGIIVLANQPPPPKPCPDAELCGPEPPATLLPGPTLQPDQTQTPGPTLPPLQTPVPTPTGQTPGPTPLGETPGPDATPVPTPESNAAPFVAGNVWRSSTLGYSFEYDPDLWKLNDEGDAFADLLLGPVELAVQGFPGDVTVQSALNTVLSQTDSFVIGRAANNRSYDALLGPSIGYVRGDGGVYSGTFKNADGTPGDPVGITIMASTNGRVTIVVLVLVSGPDRPFGGGTLQHAARKTADGIVKTFLWEGQ